MKFWGAVLLAALACCSDRATGSRRPPVILIGVDGLEWTLLARFAGRGHLPHLSGLIRRGVSGKLATLMPTVSPAIWTTIATGKLPEDHGVLSFAYHDAGELRLYTSGHRRTKAVWNILTDQGRDVDCIGWWCTYPVEPIQGVMVAQTNTREQADIQYARNVWKGTVREDVPDQVHPLEREAELLRIAQQTRERLPELERATFGTPGHPFHELSRRLWENTTWALAADQTYREIATHLLRTEEPPDLLMVYFGAVDVVSHRFLRYLQPDLYAHPPSAADVEDFRGVIRSAYQWVDDAVGELLELAPEATIIVISDHGFHPVNMDKEFDPDAPPMDVNSGGHTGAPDGVFLAAGPGIASAPRETLDSVERIGGVCDVLPTVLALLDLPVADDFCGAVLTSVLAPDAAAAGRVATYDDEEWLRQRRERLEESQRLEALLAGQEGEDASRRSEEERIQQLRELGYVLGGGEGEEPPPPPPEPRTPEGPDHHH